MLHYNYTSPLSHFLYGPGVSGDAECSPGQTTPTSVEDMGHKTPGGAANKSFTIAAILGLKDAEREDLTAVVNLSVHQGISERGVVGVGSGGSMVSECNRLQLPVMRHGVPSAASVPYPPPNSHHQQHHQQRTVRGLKHVPGTGGGGNSSSTPSKKSSSSKSKRVRTIFTPEQLERLEAEFERQQYMVGPERLYLAHTLQLTEAQVKVWFQNRRIKWRKHHLEITHQRLAAIKQQQQLQQQLLTDHTADTLDSNNSDDNTTDTTDAKNYINYGFNLLTGIKEGLEFNVG